MLCYPFMRLTLLIPVLNEIQLIEESLHRWKLPEGNWEVLVVDAGSRDGTREKAREICETFGWKFVPAALGKPSIGATVEAGLKEATGERVLVLPCDCFLSARALEVWRKMAEQGAICGGFSKRYSPSHAVLSIYAYLQNLIRTRWLRHLVWTNGIYFPRETKIPTLGFLEDVLLSDHLRKNPGWRFIPLPIQVSARRYYPKKILRRMLVNFSILTFFRLGYRDFAKLKRLYLWLN